MKSFEQMFFLGGLPRTGSSLLTNILSQNPDILSEGTSGLLGTLQAVVERLNEKDDMYKAIINTNREKDFLDFIENIPHEYYKTNQRKFIVDKNRAWSANFNIELVRKYINENPKIILMVRSVEEITKSFFSLYKKNPHLREMFFKNSDPFISAFNFLLDGILYHKENILLISYNELISNPKETIDKIYNFLEIPHFTHNFERIATIFPEGDYDLPGLHEVRTSISKREINIELTEDEQAEVDYFQRKIDIALKKAGIENVF